MRKIHSATVIQILMHIAVGVIAITAYFKNELNIPLMISIAFTYVFLQAYIELNELKIQLTDLKAEINAIKKQPDKECLIEKRRNDTE